MSILRSKIICGFAGIGKSTLAENFSNILDAESSYFSKLGSASNPEFPSNYIEYIISSTKMYHRVLTSTHKSVVRGLLDRNQKLQIIVPDYNLKSEYLNRYRERGSSLEFINNMDSNWISYIDDLKSFSRECDILKIRTTDFYLTSKCLEGLT